MTKKIKERSDRTECAFASLLSVFVQVMAAAKRHAQCEIVGRIFRGHETPHSSLEIAYRCDLQGLSIGAVFRDHKRIFREFFTELYFCFARVVSFGVIHKSKFTVRRQIYHNIKWPLRWGSTEIISPIPITECGIDNNNNKIWSKKKYQWNLKSHLNASIQIVGTPAGCILISMVNIKRKKLHIKIKSHIWRMGQIKHTFTIHVDPLHLANAIQIQPTHVWCTVSRDSTNMNFYDHENVCRRMYKK